MPVQNLLIATAFDEIADRLESRVPIRFASAPTATPRARSRISSVT